MSMVRYIEYESLHYNYILCDKISFYSQLNCCGIKDYSDWFATRFGNGANVPDSCCLLVTENCGENIASKTKPSDEIITNVR